MRKKTVLISIAATLAAVVLGGLLVAGVVVFGGLYNIAANTQHLQPTYTVLETAARKSVKLRARNIATPPLADEQLVLRGAACFRDKCVQCHGAPGVAQDGFGQSMQPLPGPLVDAHRHWLPRELFWITRHGIKMSGMPAWELRLTEDELWSVVAFMQRLPELNAQQYARMASQAPPPPSCGRELPGAALPPLAVGDVRRGQDALFQYACNSCHVIPGVTGPSTAVGPPLKGMASRALIAGKLPNTQQNLVLWLRSTQQVKPGTAMPQMGVTQQDARDIAAYLATLD